MTERRLYMKVENKFLKVREWFKAQLQKSAIGRVIFKHYQKRDIWAFSELAGMLKGFFILIGITAICYGISDFAINIAAISSGLISTISLMVVAFFGVCMILSFCLTFILWFCMPLSLIDDFVASILFA